MSEASFLVQCVMLIIRKKDLCNIVSEDMLVINSFFLFCECLYNVKLLYVSY